MPVSCAGSVGSTGPSEPDSARKLLGWETCSKSGLLSALKFAPISSEFATGNHGTLIATIGSMFSRTKKRLVLGSVLAASIQDPSADRLWALRYRSARSGNRVFSISRLVPSYLRYSQGILTIRALLIGQLALEKNTNPTPTCRCLESPKSSLPPWLLPNHM